MRQTVAEYVVRHCEHAGIRNAFGVIGSGILDVMDALPRVSGIRYYANQHEQGAVFAADGYARITGEPALCIATVGSGATNLVGGVAQAYTESSPMIVLVGEKSTEIIGRGASNFHEIDHVAVFSPVAKLALRLERADRIAEVMNRAFRTALSGRKGPVVIALPSDLQKVEVDLELPQKLHRPMGTPAGDRGEVERAHRLLLEAQRPVMLLGGGVAWAQATSDALRLAERLSVPIVVSQMRKGMVSEDHPLAAGAAGSLGGSLGAAVLGESDCILAVGCTLSEVTTSKYSPRVIPPAARLIHVDIDENEIGKVFPVDVGIIGDAGAVLRQLLSANDAVPEGPDQNRIQWLQDVQSRVKRHWLEVATEAARPVLSRYRILQTTRQVLDHTALVLAESGATHMWANYAFRAVTPLLCPGDYSIMGSGYGMALGVQVARPDQTVVSFTGDGAAMMILSELATAVRYGLNVVMIVPRNNVYGSVVSQQHQGYGGRYVGTELDVPDLAAVAKAFGAHGERVTMDEQFEPALRRALAAGKPAVLDVHLADEGPITPPGMLRYGQEEKQ